MRKLALATGLLVFMGLAPSAKAVPVDISYNVAGSLAVLNGAIPIGTFTGTATIRYRGSGTLSAPVVESGYAQFMSWNQNGVILASGGLLGTAVVTGVQTFLTGAQQKGTLTGGGLVFLPLAGVGTASAHCNNTGAGTNCTGVVGFPASVPTSGPLTIGTLVEGLASAPITTGAGDAKTVFTLFAFLGTFNTIAIEGTATLTEVGRTQVPEPSSLSMLWVGLAGLAGGRSFMRRRARGASRS